MTSVRLTSADTRQVLRYMGTPPEQTDEALVALVQDCDRALREAVQPRWLSLTAGIAFEAEGVRLDSGLLLPGRDILTHLAGCDRVVLFCATLGAEADRLIRTAQCTDVLRALALDCTASDLVEQLCDRAEQTLHAALPGCHFPYRYSPGYGDLPIALNACILDLLDAPRKLGLCVTDSGLLTPRKSVTALLGVSRHPIDKHKRSCLGCPAHDGCPHRKTGGHCGFS